MRVKDTLNLGKTKFKMRGNLPVKELERENAWDQNHVYEQRQKLNEGKPTFVLHDGPPYANGDIHMGHAMNKISKDIIVRYKSMSGFRSPYVPGWDTHGLPIEQKLTQAGYDRKKMSTNEFRKLCHDYAMEQVERQKKEFKRLGVAGEWDNPYLTLAPEFEANEVRVFGKMAQRGMIYRGKKPVIWSWSSESALAEAEIFYKDIESPSIFFAEKVIDGKGVLDDNTYYAVWTTTPWTLPASMGTTVNANFDYSVVQPEGSDRKYVVATELLPQNAEYFGWDNYKILKHVDGKDLEGITAQHPFMPDRKLLTMLGDFVTTDAGTGLVHTAPGFGEDDFIVGKKYGLEIFVDVDETGHLMANAGKDFEGVFYEDANKVSIDKLKQLDLLLHYMPIVHSYPFDWRTKKPVIYRATEQWFASVDKIKDEILEQIDNHISFKPDWGKKRLHNMIENRGDWVISRQRVWGVPLPIFYGEDGTPILDQDTINHVAELFDKYGSNVWFERDAKDLLPDGYTNLHSPNGKFTKENDIMDVWFDSGSSHQGVLAARDYLTYPADMYLEGSDQYRGWFNSSIITSVAFSGKAPYKQLLSQGFTLDGQGHKMSKSLGNTVAPIDVIDKMGADIVRLWVTSVDTSADVRVSTENFVKISDSYKKLRNTLRYMLANTSDFDPKTNAVEYDQLSELDKYMLVKFNRFVASLEDHYDHYDFLPNYRELMKFINADLSAFYLDVAKDILYIDPKDSRSRRSMQTVMYKMAVGLTKLLTPVIPHTTEEVWSFLKEDEEYVQLAEMPTVNHYHDEDALLHNWEQFMAVREYVLKALEESRDQKMIGKASEAKLDLYLSDGTQRIFDSLNTNVQQVLMTSQLELGKLDDAPSDAQNFNDEVAIKVSPAQGKTCRRCRLVKTDVGSDPEYPDFCARCAQIVKSEFPETATEGFED